MWCSHLTHLFLKLIILPYVAHTLLPRVAEKDQTHNPFQRCIPPWDIQEVEVFCKEKKKNICIDVLNRIHGTKSIITIMTKNCFYVKRRNTKWEKIIVLRPTKSHNTQVDVLQSYFTIWRKSSHICMFKKLYSHHYWKLHNCRKIILLKL